MANVGTGAAGRTLIGTGNGASPTFAQIGTNSGLTNHGLVIAQGNGSFVATATGSTGQILQSGGPSADPVYSSSVYPSSNVQGDIIYGSSSNVLTTLPKNTTATRYLANTGASNNPNWDQVNLSNGVTNILPVANGGTGNSSLTAYAVLCGGTTSTNPVQSIASVGTANQVLTSNGAGALPTFQSISATSAFNQVVIRTFTGNDTYTPTTGMKYCTILCVGGGGGGGGTSTTTGLQASSGAGGGGGGAAYKTVTAATIGASQAVTIGAGGTAGAVGGGTGGAGGTTSVGSLCVATGGAGGTGSGVQTAVFFTVTGVLGGIGTTGDILLRGDGGNVAVGSATTSFTASGMGGCSILGGGAPSIAGTGALGGNVGGNYGGGASGGTTGNNASQQVGGVGGAGVVYIIEYVSA